MKGLGYLKEVEPIVLEPLPAHACYSQVTGSIVRLNLGPDDLPPALVPEACEPMVMEPDAEYNAEWSENPKKIFMHRLLWPYYSLVKRYFVDQTH